MHREYLTHDRKDRAKAASLVVLTHMMLGVLLLTGLALHLDRHRDTSLVIFDVKSPPPPAEVRAEKPASASPAPAGRKAASTPVVAPRPAVPIVTPLAAAPVAGQDASTAAGASASGLGTGAGGVGTGSGGGGTAIIGARLIAGSLGRRDYPMIASLGSSRGTAELLLLVNQAGRVERCRVLQSSGNPQVDTIVCQLMTERASFSPAHSGDGTLYYQDVHYFPRWGR